MKRWLLIAIAAFATAGFVALGVWQIERRAWKLALIERVEQRVHAAPVAAPGPNEWPALNRENAEYRHVTVTGRFLEGRQTLVRAVTELGEGYWLMEPLQTDQGFVVLVNRGFVPPEWRKSDGSAVQAAQADDGVHPYAEDATKETSAGAPNAPRQPALPPAAAQPSDGTPAAPEAVIAVTGLLRITEPHGALLRSNAPADNRWYSRDVEAISHAQHLTGIAPYFIDAQPDPGAASDSSRPPVAGLTVIQFRNSHLQYALTWFALALMALALGVRVARTR